jgi:hypothetical protein
MNWPQYSMLTGWVDYDRSQLHSLTDLQKLSYLRRRVNIVLLNPLAEMHRNLLAMNSEQCNVLCFGTVICCAIEALGKYHTGLLGRRQSGANFRAFITRFMDPAFATQFATSLTYADVLWDAFRNGLAHGFAVKHGGYEMTTHGYFAVANGQLEINPTFFYRDFHQAVNHFFANLQATPRNAPAFLAFRNAFDEIMILGH